MGRLDPELNREILAETALPETEFRDPVKSFDFPVSSAAEYHCPI